MSHLFLKGRLGRIECIKRLSIGLWLSISAMHLLDVLKIFQPYLSDSPFLQKSAYHIATGTLWAVTAFSLLYLTTTLIGRLHDQNKTGWFLLVSLVPVLNLFLYFAMLFIPGDTAWNRYGHPNRKKISAIWPLLALTGIVLSIELSSQHVEKTSTPANTTELSSTSFTKQ